MSKLLLHRFSGSLRPACRGLALAGFAVVLCPRAVDAQKTDVVTLRNGDSITGEIREMTLGQLRLNTDAAGNIYIEWPQVAGLRSTRMLEMELASGIRVFGNLEPLDDGRLAIVLPDRRLEIPLASLVSITAIESNFWTRLDGLISFGFDFAKANESRTLNADFDVNYRARAFEISIDSDAYLQSQAGIEKTTRASVSFSGTWKFADRWGVVGISGFEHNAEIALDLRTTATLGISRTLSQTNHVRWRSVLGLGANWEKFVDEPRSAASLEGVAATGFDWFVFGDRETSFNATLAFFPNLSDWGRVRMDFDTRLRRELVLDFFIAFSGFSKFDSRAPIGMGEAGKTNDYGFSISLGYDF
jgi:hypothetical protein